MKTQSKARTAKRTPTPRKKAPMEREVSIPAVIGDLSPAQRVWVAAELLPTAPRAEVIRVAQSLGVKPSAAATQLQLARYGQGMRALAVALPPAVKSKIVHAGIQAHRAQVAQEHAEAST